MEIDFYFFQETSGNIRRAINRSREADSEGFTEAQEVVAENAKNPTPIAVIILPSNFSPRNIEEDGYSIYSRVLRSRMLILDRFTSFTLIKKKLG